MPLDSTTKGYDPFAAAGLVPLDAPDTPATPATPAAPAEPPQYRPSIDVGPSRPGAKPGEFGSQQTPARRMPGVVPPAPTAPPAPPAVPPAPAAAPPAPAAGGAPAVVQAAPPPTPAPPVVTPAAPPAPPAAAPAAPPAAPPAPAPAAPAAPTAAPFDPYAAAGLQPVSPNDPPAKLPAQAPPASHPATTASDTPWYQSVWDTVKAIDDGLPASNRSMTHALMAGYDEDIAAAIAAPILAYRKGISFSEAQAILKQQLQEDRHQLEQQHPYMSGVGTGTGIATQALLSGNLYNAGKGLLPYLGNIAMGATQGGITSFGLSEGNLQQRLDDARKGAEWGAAGTAVLPYVTRMIGGIWRSLTPKRQVDIKAGTAIREAAETPQPTFDRPPIRNFPVGTGSATNNPGLAAAERAAATENDAGAAAIRAGQQQAIIEHATQPQPGGVTLAGRPVPQLATRAMTPSAAAQKLQNAFRQAWDVFKSEERRLWSTPNLQSFPLNINNLKQTFYNTASRMPLRFQRAVARTPGLEDTVRDLFRLPNHATLLDLNDIRSDLLAIARNTVDPLGQKVAQRLADDLLRVIENDANIRANPAVWGDYKAARDFTRKMWDTIGQKPFQNLIDPNADPRTVGGIVKFGPGLSGERIPGGIANIGDELDNIRQQWLALGHSGFPEHIADAARRELGESTVDYIINTMIQPIAESQTGAEIQHLNNLVKWIDRNRGWLVGGRLLVPEQLELLDAIRESAQMGARLGNLRGGRGSETYERWMRGAMPRAIDIFASPLAKLGAGAVGGAVGLLFGHWGEMGLLALLGAGAEGLGAQALQNLYRVPSQLLRQRLIEAAQNPEIAKDLLAKANQFKATSEATRRWLAALGADIGAHTENYLSPNTQ